MSTRQPFGTPAAQTANGGFGGGFGVTPITGRAFSELFSDGVPTFNEGEIPGADYESTRIHSRDGQLRLMSISVSMLLFFGVII